MCLRAKTLLNHVSETPPRYTEWVAFSGPPKYQPNWNIVCGVELYDHEADPEENHNQAHNPTLIEVVKELSDQLHAGWRHALPSV